MDVDFGFLCDYAQAADKISALGIGFERIYAAELPATHLHMSLVLRLRFHSTEAGLKHLEIEIIDSDGNLVSDPPMEMDIQVNAPETGTETAVQLAVSINGLTFQRYGDYSLHVLVDKHEVHRIGFSVVEAQLTS